MTRLDREKLANTPLPETIPSVASWKELPLKERGEKLVPLGIFSDYPEIFTDSIYFGERDSSPYPTAGLEGSLLTGFVRKSVADALRKAQQILPDNLYIVVFDPYRTLKVQKSLYEQYYESLKKIRPTWDENELVRETQKYVSIPSDDLARPSPHNTGGTIDLALFELPEGQVFDGSNIELVQTKGKLLNFGTSYDYGDKEAALDYFEKLEKEQALSPDEKEAMENRRILFRIMSEVGFEPFESEWWHYNSKEIQMGAKTSGAQEATFGGVELSSENRAHEENRRAHYFKQLEEFAAGNAPLSPKASTFPCAAIIKPSI